MPDQNINVIKSGGEFKNQVGVNASYQMDENGNIRLNLLPNSTLDSEQWRVGFFDEPWSMESRVAKATGSAGIGVVNGASLRFVDQAFGFNAATKGSILFLLICLIFFIYGSRTSRSKHSGRSYYGSWMLGSHVCGLIIGRFS